MKPWAPEVADSPYAPGDRSAEAQAWRSEAISAEATRRHVDGTFGAFSDDEMARARSVLGQAHDPAAEILGIEPTVPSPEFVPLDLGPIIEVIRSTAEEITRVFEASISLIHEIQEAAAAPDLNRRRHGSASWCPKHGETRGGTCFRCAR